MEITGYNLDILTTSFNALYSRGLAGSEARQQWQDVAMTTTSDTESEDYGWLKDLPGMREWIGDRQLDALAFETYALKNRDFELTVGVDRNKIEDDKFGTLDRRFEMLGAAVNRHQSELIWPLLTHGFSDKFGLAYDGQYFFDTDHPYQRDGVAKTQPNTHPDNINTGSKPWFLVDTMALGKPIVFQQRKKADTLTRMTSPDDEGVFMRRQFRWGVDCRDNAGYGFYQACWGSKATLNVANFESALVGLAEMNNDEGAPLGIMPDTLFVPPSLYRAAKNLVRDRDENGADNVYADEVKVVRVPWLR